MATKKNQLSIPTVLAFSRRLNPSDAVFAHGRWADRDNTAAWQPVSVVTKTVRGTISNRLKPKDDATRMAASDTNANIQTVDSASLPMGSDTLRVEFTLLVLGRVGVPDACNDMDFRHHLANVVQSYKDEFSFTELGYRYARSIAHGTFLWRNQLSAERVAVQVVLETGDSEEGLGQWFFENPADDDDALHDLGNVIATALSDRSYVRLRVRGFALMGEGQEVYPSQDFVLADKAPNGKSKALYQRDGVAAFHSQKVGNALRTIDDWYPMAERNGSASIAVEPYGAVTHMGAALRGKQSGGSEDFYSLFDRWLSGEGDPLRDDQKHYVMAVLIRGGVFGAGKESKDQAAA